MTIIDKAMISVNSQSEYGILVLDKNGLNALYHLNKNFDKVNPILHDFVDIKSNSLANGRLYFISAKESNIDSTIFLVEINSDYPVEHLKWEAKTFLEGFLSLHRNMRIHPVELNLGEKAQYRQTLISFESFINFVHVAYSNDYQNWKLLESDLSVVRKAFTIPMLP